MLFSLVVPTVNRTLELARLLTSISGQKFTRLSPGDVEVIIVDQNLDDRLLGVIDPYRSCFNIVRLTAPSLGQSNAKNLGMRILRGKYVAFPDDDCFYAEDTLEKVFLAFDDTQDRCAIFGRCQDMDSKRYLLNYPSGQRIISRPKDPSAFLGLQIAQFYTACMVKAVGNFDVDMCSGGKWGSGEETDFAIRLLKTGYSINFRPDIIVYHPLFDTRDMSKLKRYSGGCGALCRKHGLYGLAFWKILKQLAGIFLFALKLDVKRAATCWVISFARLDGFLKYGKKAETAMDRDMGLISEDRHHEIDRAR